MQTVLSKSGYISAERAAELDAVAAAAAEKDRRLLAAKLRQECGLFPRDADAAFDRTDVPRRRLTPQQFDRYTAVLAELKTLLKWPGLLILSGDNGPGKTHMAAMAVNDHCDAGRSAYYCTSMHYYRLLASTFDAPGKTQLDLYRRLHGYDLLVLDELEIRPAKPWHDNELRDLINARYGHRLSTVLITNKSPAQLLSDDGGGEPYLPRAIRDRLQHEGGVLLCDWPTLRAHSTK